MKTTHLPDDLHRDLRLEAVRLGITAQEATSRAVRMWLAMLDVGEGDMCDYRNSTATPVVGVGVCDECGEVVE